MRPIIHFNIILTNSHSSRKRDWESIALYHRIKRMRFSNRGSSADVVPWSVVVQIRARFFREQAEGRLCLCKRWVSRARYHVWRPVPIKLPRTRSSACTCTSAKAHAHRITRLSHRISSLLAVGKINRVEVNANEAFAEPGTTATATPREESTRRGTKESIY